MVVGLIQHILVNGDVGYGKNVQRGIIAAVADQSTETVMGCNWNNNQWNTL